MLFIISSPYWSKIDSTCPLSQILIKAFNCGSLSNVLLPKNTNSLGLLPASLTSSQHPEQDTVCNRHCHLCFQWSTCLWLELRTYFMPKEWKNQLIQIEEPSWLFSVQTWHAWKTCQETSKNPLCLLLPSNHWEIRNPVSWPHTKTRHTF